VTQQNASASEQMSATSEELAAQAEQLQASIAFFRVESSARTAAAPILPGKSRPKKATSIVKAKTATAPSRVARKSNSKSNGSGFALDMTNGSSDGRDAEFERY
jgi:methyl-accepting chemotaxis protein